MINTDRYKFIINKNNNSVYKNCIKLLVSLYMYVNIHITYVLCIFVKMYSNTIILKILDAFVIKLLNYYIILALKL